MFLCRGSPKTVEQIMDNATRTAAKNTKAIMDNLAAVLLDLNHVKSALSIGNNESSNQDTGTNDEETPAPFAKWLDDLTCVMTQRRALSVPSASALLPGGSGSKHRHRSALANSETGYQTFFAFGL